MAHLSSCYFCGTALDESLGTYRIGDERTVTLCRACHRKLEAVLDTGGSLSEATQPQPVSVTTSNPPEPRRTDSGSENRETVESVPPRKEKAESEVRGEQSATAGETEGRGSDDTDETRETETGTDDETDQSGAVDEEILAADDIATELDEELETNLLEGETGDETEAEATADDGETETEATADDGETEAEATADDEASETGEDDEEPTDPLAESETVGGTSDDGTVTETDDSTSQAEMDTDSHTEGAEETPEVNISALEYNKVMRLLQNRSFPVERDEIVTVAANAYGLAESECATVIDLAVDRGLLTEADGQLRRPDDG